MTRLEFTAICGEMLLDPALVLEDVETNLEGRLAVQAGADALREYLKENY